MLIILTCLLLPLLVLWLTYKFPVLNKVGSIILVYIFGCALGLAGIIPDDELNENNIIPKAFDPIVKDTVAKAVAEAARRSGVARI